MADPMKNLVDLYASSLSRAKGIKPSTKQPRSRPFRADDSYLLPPNTINQAVKVAEPYLLGHVKGAAQMTKNLEPAVRSAVGYLPDGAFKRKLSDVLNITRAGANETLSGIDKAEKSGVAVSPVTSFLAENSPTLLTAGGSNAMLAANKLIGAASDYGEGKSVEGITAGLLVPGNNLASNVTAPIITDQIAAANARLLNMLGLDQQPKQQTR